jgi:hypothetical protein
MKPDFKTAFIISILVNIGLLTILYQRSLKENPLKESFFSHNPYVSKKTLEKKGFNLIKPFNKSYAKQEKDTLQIFHFLSAESDSAFRTSIEIKRLTDSLEIVKWIHKNDAFICSPWEKRKKEYIFFVQDKKSGLISKCISTPRSLFIIFHYPVLSEKIKFVRDTY